MLLPKTGMPGSAWIQKQRWRLGRQVKLKNKVAMGHVAYGEREITSSNLLDIIENTDRRPI